MSLFNTTSTTTVGPTAGMPGSRQSSVNSLAGLNPESAAPPSSAAAQSTAQRSASRLTTGSESVATAAPCGEYVAEPGAAGAPALDSVAVVEKHEDRGTPEPRAMPADRTDLALPIDLLTSSGSAADAGALPPPLAELEMAGPSKRSAPAWRQRSASSRSVVSVPDEPGAASAGAAAAPAAGAAQAAESAPVRQATARLGALDITSVASSRMFTRMSTGLSAPDTALPEVVESFPTLASRYGQRLPPQDAKLCQYNMVRLSTLLRAVSKQREQLAKLALKFEDRRTARLGSQPPHRLTQFVVRSLRAAERVVAWARAIQYYHGYATLGAVDGFVECSEGVLPAQCLQRGAAQACLSALETSATRLTSLRGCFQKLPSVAAGAAGLARPVATTSAAVAALVDPPARSTLQRGSQLRKFALEWRAGSDPTSKVAPAQSLHDMVLQLQVVLSHLPAKDTDPSERLRRPARAAASAARSVQLASDAHKHGLADMNAPVYMRATVHLMKCKQEMQDAGIAWHKGGAAAIARPPLPRAGSSRASLKDKAAAPPPLPIACPATVQAAQSPAESTARSAAPMSTGLLCTVESSESGKIPASWDATPAWAHGHAPRSGRRSLNEDVSDDDRDPVVRARKGLGPCTEQSGVDASRGVGAEEVESFVHEVFRADSESDDEIQRWNRHNGVVNARSGGQQRGAVAETLDTDLAHELMEQDTAPRFAAVRNAWSRASHKVHHNIQARTDKQKGVPDIDLQAECTPKGNRKRRRRPYR